LSKEVFLLQLMKEEKKRVEFRCGIAENDYVLATRNFDRILRHRESNSIRDSARNSKL